MSTRRIQVLIVVLLAIGMAACGSPSVRYYVVDPGPAPVRASATPLPVTLLVARVTSSSLYRADRLVYASGPLQLGVYEYHRWASPPADLMQNILIDSLRSTGQYRSVSRVGTNLRGSYILRGQLNALDESDKPALTGRFSFQLELFDPKAGATIWSDSYVHEEPVNGKTVADVVDALDRNVRAGMDQLVGNLGQYFAAHPPQQ